MLNFVFLHGGPGFNSYAERALLGPVLREQGHDVLFWNEPSRLRPGGDPFSPVHAYEAWLGSAERAVLSATVAGRVYVIAHSFTVHAALEIVRRHSELVAGLVVIAPAAAALLTYTNVLRLGERDLAQSMPEVARAIKGHRMNTRALMDDEMLKGFQLLMHDEHLFTHYFADRQQYLVSQQAKALPEAQLDVDSLVLVLQDFRDRSSLLHTPQLVRVPTLVISGALDPVTPHHEQMPAMLADIPHAQSLVFEACSHYLHLDRPQQFVETVVGWARKEAV